MKVFSAFLFTIGVLVLSTVIPNRPSGVGASPGSEVVVIDATRVAGPPNPLPFIVEGRSKTGHVLSANSRYLLLDGKPWFPVVGEFHFSRYPAADWEEELLKMKAGGIQVVSTYVFWIHQEEIEGDFDWAGQRDLRRFVELCARHDLYVWVRIGPWDHGECRNGGFPDWVLEKCSRVRQVDPLFLSYVQRFYNQIGMQLKGLLWANGGPVIAVQLDNEYSARGPGKGSEYILTLRRMARKAGLDVPFYTVTGWDDAVIPSRDILPVFGGYADAFWSRSTKELPPNPNYFFTSIRCDENVGNDLRSKRRDIDALDANYPYLVAEMGAGMEVAYHRRPVVTADDTGALALVKLGSGVSMFGYYVFHGGTNPDGKRTTLQESQVTGYPNDSPVKSYDYEAPLGEFGQVNPSFRVLKILHMFVTDFGSELAEMPPYFPKVTPPGREDVSTPRVAARIANNRGFVFINNYQRLYPLPERKNFQIELRLPNNSLTIPRFATHIPAQTYTIWPVNLKMGPGILRYATAQLLCRLRDSRTYVFFAWPGIPVEFAFDSASGMKIESSEGKITNAGDTIFINGLQPGKDIAVRVIGKGGESAQVLLLSRDQALKAWKPTIAGIERLILSPDDLYFLPNSVHLLTSNAGDFAISVFPAFPEPPTGFIDAGNDGVFHRYTAREKRTNIALQIEELASAADAPPIRMEHGVALVPDDSEFASAARWNIRIAQFDSRSLDNEYLIIRYKGDVARLYAGKELFTDNFYDGAPWVIGLKDIPPKDIADGLELRILALRKDAPIYLPMGAWSQFPPSGEIADLERVEIQPEYHDVMRIAKTEPKTSIESSSALRSRPHHNDAEPSH
jgi:beta-galactosidase